MSKQVTVSRTIKANPERVWEIIAGIGGVHNWFPEIISGSRVEGEGVNARRICEFADGSGTLYETIKTIDHENKVVQYAIDESPLPLESYLGTMKVNKLGENETEFVWTGDFVATDKEAEDQLTKMLEAVYDKGITSLGKYAVENGSVQAADA